MDQANIPFITSDSSNILYQEIHKVVSAHPGELTWNPKMEVWKLIFLFN